MVEGLSTVLWVAGIAFALSFFFRLWWIAALITAGVVAMEVQSAGTGLSLNALLYGGLPIAIPAFAGAALGKFMHKRNADPLDPTNNWRERNQ